MFTITQLNLNCFTHTLKLNRFRATVPDQSLQQPGHLLHTGHTRNIQTERYWRCTCCVRLIGLRGGEGAALGAGLSTRAERSTGCCTLTVPWGHEGHGLRSSVPVLLRDGAQPPHPANHSFTHSACRVNENAIIFRTNIHAKVRDQNHTIPWVTPAAVSPDMSRLFPRTSQLNTSVGSELNTCQSQPIVCPLCPELSLNKM